MCVHIVYCALLVFLQINGLSFTLSIDYQHALRTFTNQYESVKVSCVCVQRTPFMYGFMMKCSCCNLHSIDYHSCHVCSMCIQTSADWANRMCLSHKAIKIAQQRITTRKLHEWSEYQRNRTKMLTSQHLTQLRVQTKNSFEVQAIFSTLYFKLFVGETYKHSVAFDI